MFVGLPQMFCKMCMREWVKNFTKLLEFSKVSLKTDGTQCVLLELQENTPLPEVGPGVTVRGRWIGAPNGPTKDFSQRWTSQTVAHVTLTLNLQFNVYPQLLWSRRFNPYNCCVPKYSCLIVNHRTKSFSTKQYHH